MKINLVSLPLSQLTYHYLSLPSEFLGNRLRSDSFWSHSLSPTHYRFFFARSFRLGAFGNCACLANYQEAGQLNCIPRPVPYDQFDTYPQGLPDVATQISFVPQVDDVFLVTVEQYGLYQFDRSEPQNELTILVQNASHRYLGVSFLSDGSRFVLAQENCVLLFAYNYSQSTIAQIGNTYLYDIRSNTSALKGEVIASPGLPLFVLYGLGRLSLFRVIKGVIYLSAESFNISIGNLSGAVFVQNLRFFALDLSVPRIQLFTISSSLASISAPDNHNLQSQVAWTGPLLTIPSLRVFVLAVQGSI